MAWAMCLCPFVFRPCGSSGAAVSVLALGRVSTPPPPPLAFVLCWVTSALNVEYVYIQLGTVLYLKYDISFPTSRFQKPPGSEKCKQKAPQRPHALGEKMEQRKPIELTRDSRAAVHNSSRAVAHNSRLLSHL